MLNLPDDKMIKHKKTVSSSLICPPLTVFVVILVIPYLILTISTV